MIFFPGVAVSSFALTASFFAAKSNLFSLAVYFGFLAVAVAFSGAFRFWATVPKEFPLSYHLS